MKLMRRFIKAIPGVDTARRMLDEWKAPVYDSFAMQALAPLGCPFLPWTSSSLRPGAVRLILNEAAINRRRAAVEFGAGVSTVFLGRLFARNGGTLVSVDHDRQWIDVVRHMLERADVPADVVTFVHASLDSKDGWYDRPTLVQQLEGRRFDIALVDGPVSSSLIDQVRLPAGAFLSEYLEDDYAIFLDDISRPGERRTADAWVQEFGWSRLDCRASGNVAIFRPKAARSYNIH